MIILGINDTHDASACLIKDGKLVAALQEERIARIKNIGGFPGNAIKTLLKSNKIDKKDIDFLCSLSRQQKIIVFLEFRHLVNFGLSICHLTQVEKHC